MFAVRRSSSISSNEVVGRRDPITIYRVVLSREKRREAGQRDRIEKIVNREGTWKDRSAIVRGRCGYVHIAMWRASRSP